MRRNWLKDQTRSRCVCYTTDDQVLDGLLHTVAKDGIVLLDVVVRSNGDDVTLAGFVYVPRDKVRVVQVP